MLTQYISAHSKPYRSSMLDTPATVNVAALRYGTPLRGAGPLLREMLQEQGFPAPRPDAGETEKFRAVLRALAA